MYLNRRLRLLAEIDPTVIERERQAIADHQSRVRLLDKLDHAKDRLNQVERYAAAGVPLRSSELPAAAHRVSYYTAAAERAGLTRPRKDHA